ncbi:hypothetical protein GCM10010277_80540 [Streptomyces longisporoflavus]|uniref:hypothetical protein n=1 Tax=Streptomyces longisporoflavus TaxID=28044 RepID=UPI00167C7665|nr:hypothetical protein [Streptomyces longisporoflavus]GGV69971.1 hypothetical protein GCM10010277_80540 [Streptomyces longisporoflavus]
MSACAPSPAQPEGRPLNPAGADNAVHRAGGPAAAGPDSRLAGDAAGESTACPAALIGPAEWRLAFTGSAGPAAQRARDVLTDSIRRAGAVHPDQLTGAFTRPAAGLCLPAGACRLLNNAVAAAVNHRHRARRPERARPAQTLITAAPVPPALVAFGASLPAVADSP